MRTRKYYLVIENATNRILHSTTDKFESMKMFDVLKKANVSVYAQCVYQ